MRRRATRSSDAYQKYFGKYVGSIISKLLPSMTLPSPVKTTYFVRPGVPIILSTNEYYREYYKDEPQYFHHGMNPYRFLLRQYYDDLPAFKPIAETLQLR